MRKGLTIVSVLALVLVGFLAMANPVAACYFDFYKEIKPVGPSDDNDAIQMGVVQYWDLYILVQAEQDMHNVYIKDRLGGELEVVYPPDGPDPYDCPGLLLITTKGKTEKVFIDWYITLLPKDTVAMLRMYISTDINPGGQQEYTSPGPHQLNSGAVIKYEDAYGNKFTETTEEFWVTVV